MKRFRKVLLLSLILSLFFALPACSGAGTTAPDAATPEATPATEVSGEAGAQASIGTFSTKDTAGNTVTESVFANADVTMVNVWATFCGYCIREMPELSDLNEEFADQGFQVLGLIGDVGDRKGGYTEEDMASVAALMDKAGADFPTLMPSKELIDSVLSQVSAYPTTFFVDHEGNLLGEPVLGAMGETFWRGAIEAYLAAAPEREPQK